MSAAMATVGGWLLSNGGILIGAISGFFGIFADHKTDKKWTYVTLAGIFAGMIWALLSANYADQQQKQATAEAIQRVDDWITKQSTETVGQVDTNTRAAINQMLENLLGVRADLAQKASPAEALAFANAGTSAGGLVANISPDRRQALTIWVFPHTQGLVDFSVLKTRLEQLAAHVPLATPKQQAALTNSVWYGMGAQLDEAKAAALIVASAGLQIRQVCPSKKSLGVANLIQIGGSVRAENLPVLSAASIQGLQAPVCAEGGTE